MGDSDRNPLKKQLSKSSLEKSLQMIPPPQQAPVTIYPGPSAGIANLSKTDLEIAQRLENLRKSQYEELPTDEEMACRLASLKGLPANHYTNSTPAGAYQRPDPRTQGQQTDDLLTQIAEEVSLEARLPNPEDELETRLARLRGEAGGARPAQPPLAGAVALPPQASTTSQAKMDAKLGEDLDDMNMDEVEALMKAASAEAEAGAERSLRELRADPEVAGAVAQAAIRRKEKKNKKKKKEGEMSEEERRSKSFDSDLEIEGGKAIDAVTEQEEVQRIIDMYTKRAQLKKEKKKRKREEAAAAAAAAAQGGGAAAAAVVVEDSDSDIEISSASDLTSDSERDSLTDELSE